jgi:hypothetical protein
MADPLEVFGRILCAVTGHAQPDPVVMRRAYLAFETLTGVEWDALLDMLSAGALTVTWKAAPQDWHPKTRWAYGYLLGQVQGRMRQAA